jgi:hypothetical protein
MATSRIDRRPSITLGPFHDDYFVELQGERRVGIERGVSHSESWSREVEQGIRRVKEAGGEADVLGIW